MTEIFFEYNTVQPHSNRFRKHALFELRRFKCMLCTHTQKKKIHIYISHTHTCKRSRNVPYASCSMAMKTLPQAPAPTPTIRNGSPSALPRMLRSSSNLASSFLLSSPCTIELWPFSTTPPVSAIATRKPQDGAQPMIRMYALQLHLIGQKITLASLQWFTSNCHLTDEDGMIQRWALCVHE